MPVQTDYPIGLGSPAEWKPWGATSDVVAAVQTADGDTSVVYQFSNGRLFIQLYTFSPILAVADPVNSASISTYAREYQPGNAERFYFHYWNSARSGSNWGEYLHLFNQTSYGIYSYDAGAASLATVNGQHGFEMKAASGTGWEIWVSACWRTVNYDFGAGGADTEFSHIIGSIAALIGGNLLLREMPRLNRVLGRIRFRPDEYEPAWRAWRNYRHPVWSF